MRIGENEVKRKRAGGKRGRITMKRRKGFKDYEYLNAAL